MTIHSTDPFATPEEQRSPLRRLRGRLAAPVTLWTADGPAGPAGLTVSSMLVAEGEPGRSAMATSLTPLSRKFCAWAWPWLP